VPVRRLPSDPNLGHLRKEAKGLQQRIAADEPAARELVQEFHPRAGELSRFKLADAQLVIARCYGFPSWPKLCSYLATVGHYSNRAPSEQENDVDRFLRLACLTYTGDDPERLEEARRMLAAQPELARASIHAMAAIGDFDTARDVLAADPGGAKQRGGPYGWEPLLYVAYSRVDSPLPEHSTLEVARLLLEHGADPNAGWVGGWGPPAFTALTGAFGYGEDAPNQPPHEYEMELARLLLEHGADPNDEQTLYNNMWRRTNGHLELLFAYGLGSGDGGPWQRRLAPMAATPTQMLEDLLLFSAGAGNAERVELLLQHGVDPNGRGTRHATLRDRSALELAITNAHDRVVELLRAAGAMEDAAEPADELIAACMRGDRTRVGRLLAADPGLAQDAIESQPDQLCSAVEQDQPESIPLLVEIGFELNPKDRTAPLHLAAYHGNGRMVDLLLELGADPTLHDPSFDATPAGWARHAHHHELAARLDAP
jgi:ankyrin repeat protein